MDIFGLSVAAIDTAIGANRAIAKWLLLRQASHWPLANAQLLRGDPDPDVREIHYSYQVNGAYYSGSFWLKKFKKMSLSELASRSVLIRYKPDSPEISFLLDSDQAGPPM